MGLSAVALLQGRSLKKGRHFSQSTPNVLCLQLQTTLLNSLYTHSLAWPLHLHLGTREGFWMTLANNTQRSRKGTTPYKSWLVHRCPNTNNKADLLSRRWLHNTRMKLEQMQEHRTHVRRRLPKDPSPLRKRS